MRCPGPEHPGSTLPNTGGGAGTSTAGVDFRTGGAVAPPGLGIVDCPAPKDDERSRARLRSSSGARPAPVAGGPVRVLVVGDSLAAASRWARSGRGRRADVRQARSSDAVSCRPGVGPRPSRSRNRPNTVTTSRRPKRMTRSAALRSRRGVVGQHLGTIQSRRPRSRVRDRHDGVAACARPRLDSALGLLTRNGARLFVATVASPAPTGCRRRPCGEPRLRLALRAHERRWPLRRPAPIEATLIDVAGKVCHRVHLARPTSGSGEPRKSTACTSIQLARSGSPAGCCRSSSGRPRPLRPRPPPRSRSSREPSAPAPVESGSRRG